MFISNILKCFYICVHTACAYSVTGIMIGWLIKDFQIHNYTTLGEHCGERIKIRVQEIKRDKMIQSF